MTRHHLAARLQRLEALRPAARADLDAETARHGHQLWAVPGARAYRQDTGDGFRLALVTAGEPLVYDVIGLGPEAAA